MNKRKAIRNELFNYPIYKAQLKSIDLEITRLKYEYQGIKGMSFDSDGGGGTNLITRSVENEVMNKEMRLNQLMMNRDKVQLCIDRIDAALEALTELQRLVIEERYFKNFDWYTVAENLGYSHQWVKRQEFLAIDKLIQVFIDK